MTRLSRVLLTNLVLTGSLAALTGCSGQPHTCEVNGVAGDTSDPCASTGGQSTPGGDSSFGGESSTGGTSTEITASTGTGGTESTGGATSDVHGTGGDDSGGYTGAGGVVTGGDSSSGGSVSTGGDSPAGGDVATGGALTTGGESGSGGDIATGGALATGGDSSSGGDSAFGGALATGGESASGGDVATGGISAMGGVSSSGGAIATGGEPAAGGESATGGDVATGGDSSSGGSTATGGATATGGESATGGDVATGGDSSSGGSTATGGATATGGESATGGDVATGGDSSSGGSTATGGATATGGSSSYSVSNDYLVNPDHAVDMIASLADFRAKSRDDLNGGFFTFVNRDGTVASDRRKGFVTITRDAWTFSRAFMVTGDERYLDHASHALDFLFAHGWDNANGGWYFTADEYGALTPYASFWDPNKFKWSFVQHYALLGIGANCDVTRDSAVCNWLQTGRSYLDTKMWDSNVSQLGYYDQANLDWTKPTNKGFTPTIDALTTNGIQAELLWPAEYHQRMVDLADITVDRLAAAMDLSNVALGFPENYDTAWKVSAGSTGADIGHILKSAWVLARVYLRNPDVRYRDAARKFLYEVLEKGGWDQARGVPYTRYNWSNGQVTKKAECWQIEQAVTGGLSNWYIADNLTDKNTFLQMTDRSLQFFTDYVVDHTYGGTYKLNNLDGTPADGKSNFYNVEYHSTEMFFFTYLYGNLLLHRQPVALYYKVPATTSEQTLQLNPVAVDDASLQIQSVTLDGTPITTFGPASREVTLPAGQGGKLRVVFGPAS